MKHYLHKFADQEAYNTAKAGANFYKPAVSLIEGDMSLRYDPLSIIPEGFVDFSLPSGTLWSTKNIGATNGNTAESWYGGYYAWGELQTKEIYNWSTYKYANGNERLIKYCPINETNFWGGEGLPDNKIVLDVEDDIATHINSSWKMPTKEDFEELITYTSKSFETNYNGIVGLNGILFVKINVIKNAYKNISLYSEMFEGELTNEIWNIISKYSLEEINELTGGQDIRTMIFKDAEYTIPAIYGTDYEFAEKQNDPSISIFIPTAGILENDESMEDVDRTNEAHYFTSDVYEEYPSHVFALYFDNIDNLQVSTTARHLGLVIRPIIP